jgi:hypothetical protein
LNIKIKYFLFFKVEKKKEEDEKKREDEKKEEGNEEGNEGHASFWKDWIKFLENKQSFHPYR